MPILFGYVIIHLNNVSKLRVNTNKCPKKHIADKKQY